MKFLRRAGWVALALLGVAVLVLALPVTSWRTGETSTPTLTLLAGHSFPGLPNRVWIDTDAACGTGPSVDPDDCLALLALLEDSRIDVVGVSTVFGNAPALTTQRVTGELVERINARRTVPVRLFNGSAQALSDASLPDQQPAHRAIASALSEGPLTFVALGPLTNLAAAAGRAPALQQNLAGIVAVMGRRPGHRFHPSEGTSTGAVFFGHGPMFSDFNFVSDPLAAEQVIGWRRPLVLLPYEVARKVEIDATSLDALATRSAAGAWVAERSREWLAFWQREVGRNGFYPFDLMAAAFILDPGQFQCASVRVWVGRDPLLGVFQRGRALLVAGNEPSAPVSNARSQEIYCAGLSGDLQRPWRIQRVNDRGARN